MYTYPSCNGVLLPAVFCWAVCKANQILLPTRLSEWIVSVCCWSRKWICACWKFKPKKGSNSDILCFHSVGKKPPFVYLYKSVWLSSKHYKVYLRMNRLIEFHYMRYIMLSCVQGRIDAIGYKVIWVNCVSRLLVQIGKVQ